MLNKILKKFGYTKRSETPTETQRDDVKPHMPPVAITISNNYGTIPKDLHQSWCGMNLNYDDATINNWNLKQQLAIVNDDTNKVMTQKQFNAKQKKNWYPYRFVNPMQDLDYMMLDNLCRFTIGGGIMKQIGRMVFGTGFEPVLELRKPTDDTEADVKLIEQHKYIIEWLKEIDEKVEYNDTDALDRTFKSKLSNAINAMLMYNRSALIFSFDDKPIEIDGIQYPEIPNSVKFAHPKDLGMIDVDQEWRIQRVQWRPIFQFVEAKDMIYLWNEQSTYETSNCEGYGTSLLSPMINNLRLIHKLDSQDFPAMAEVAWAASLLAWIKPEGQNENQRLQEMGAIARGITAGGYNVIGIDPENVETDIIDLNPQVGQFTDMIESQVRRAVSSLSLPQSIFQDESQSNRATMMGKIQLATQTVIEPMREMIGDQFCKQWYQRWFHLRFRDSEESKLFKIKVKWHDLKIEQPSDKIESFLMLDASRQFSIKGTAEYLGMPNIATMLEPGKEVIQGGVPQKADSGGTSKNLNKDKESKEDRL